MKYVSILFLLLFALASCGSETSDLSHTTAGSFYVSPPAVTASGYNGSTYDSKTFTIHGGTAPYTVTSNNPTVIGPSPLTLNPDGQSFTVNPGIVTGTTTVVLTVNDSAGSLPATAIVTVNVPALTITLSGVSITSDTISVGGTKTYGISGGVSPYTAVATQNQNDITLTLNGNSLTVNVAATATAGETFPLSITDSKGTSKQLTITAN